MAATGHLHAKNSSVKIVCGAGTINLSANGNSVDIDYNADQLEATAYGDTSHTNLDGLLNFGLTYSGWWAGSGATLDGTNSKAGCMLALIGNGATCMPVVYFAPNGSAAASLNYAACVNVQALPMSFPADGMATMNATFALRGGSMTALTASWA